MQKSNETNELLDFIQEQLEQTDLDVLFNEDVETLTEKLYTGYLLTELWEQEEVEIGPSLLVKLTTEHADMLDYFEDQKAIIEEQADVLSKVIKNEDDNEDEIKFNDTLDDEEEDNPKDMLFGVPVKFTGSDFGIGNSKLINILKDGDQFILIAEANNKK